MAILECQGDDTDPEERGKDKVAAKHDPLIIVMAVIFIIIYIRRNL